jgi:hypothetical protein
MRKDIEEIIRTHVSDPAEAALTVCEYLEEAIGLAGNGWFDDDKQMLARLGWMEA